MTVWLKQSTSLAIKFGPFIDDTDGKTAETALTIQKANVRLSKNGGNMIPANANQGNADAGAPHDEIGYYDCSLDDTDTNTLGKLKVMVHLAGALPVWETFMVMPANVYDSLVSGSASDYLQVDAVQVNGTGQTAKDLGAAIGTPVALDGGTASLAGMLTKLADDNGGATFDATNDSLNKIKAAVPAAAPSAASVADAVWDEAVADHTTGTAFGGKLQTAVSAPPAAATIAGAVLDEALGAHAGFLTTLATETGGNVAAAKAVTDKLDTGLEADGSNWKATADFLQDAPTGSGSGLDAAGVRTAIGLATANLDAQLADLPTVAEFEARTLAAADYTIVSDLPVAPDNASILAILEDTGTTLDTLIKDLPTNSELATALAGADDAVLAAIAALNNLSSAGAQSAAAAAFNVYHPPTKAELDSAVAPLALETTAQAVLADTGTAGVVVASGSKTGYSLASDGLDSIAVTAPAGVASNFREMVVQLWRYFFKKTTMTATQIKTYDDTNLAVVTTQTVTDDGTTQTHGAAS